MLHDEVMRPPVITGDVRSDIAKLRTYLYGLSEQLQNVFDSIQDDEKNAEYGKLSDAVEALERSLMKKPNRGEVTKQGDALNESITRAEESIKLQADKIEMMAGEILLHADDILTLQSGVGDNLAQITLMDGKIEAQAKEIDLHAKDILTLRSGVDDNAAQITLMDGRITANAKDITMKADKIDLEGFVTVDGVLESLADATIQGSLYVEDTLDAYSLVGSEATLGDTSVTSLKINEETAATVPWVNSAFYSRIYCDANFATHTWVVEHFVQKEG